MAAGSSLHLYNELSLVQSFGPINKYLKRSRQVKTFLLSSCSSRQDVWSLQVSDRIYKPIFCISYKYNVFKCQSSALSSSSHVMPLLRNTSMTLTRSCNALLGCPQFLELIPAVGIITFAAWGLGPLMRSLRSLFRNDSNWKKSKTYYISTLYVQPILLWTGTILICRVLDPLVLPSEASQAVKIRFLNFIRSLSTVLAITYCLSSLIQQSQKFFMESSGPDDTRKMGFEFAGKAVYTAVWIAAVSLFMELLGFSTQKWITAGGLGTVLLTLAGREIFTNFLSSVMIHATRPFVVNEWIQTKIEGYEVSGTVEHVGWWSPTIIRGDDREAIHIPNHKFTVTVVRNLSQKTHWRIKTHLAISHLDVNKISNIVADMRKVLAKNPQIEQQRLHRRIFLDNIDPENQALRILVSCFVKTSHFEEYLCVKEAVLLDLLRVISHHRARLATPIRTVQKIYGDPDIENIPFAETIFRRSATANRPLLLIDPQSRINSDDKAKSRSTSRANEDQSSKTITTAEPRFTSTSEDSNLNNLDKNQQKKPIPGDALPKSIKADSATALSSNSPSTTQIENIESAQSTTKTVSQKHPISESTTEQGDAKNEGEKVQTAKPQVARPAFEDNIVLGLALEGSKRTLPIEEGMGPSSTQLESNELASGRNGSVPSTSSKETKGSVPAVDQRDQEN
ncbi:mechanosensitive ion channel protein 3, chloroplastic-like [Canna indica]|uniref:Mechanosensitive ion channel protein 3, chloroplastic-like n=1 Tax=Canna indica TaxID=4628 RepID=A0AAQ3L4Q0_9LILI|nr:mechanosensitive ion channel protein 3, chloroplastic-like [Canna indica]